MKRNISEELPARKFAPAAVNSSPDDSKKEKSSESDPAKKAKQAVYDIRYRARREDIPLLQAFSQYMQNSSLGEQDRAMIKAKLFGKDGGGMKAEDFKPLFMEAASDSISNALYKVFVKESNREQEQIQLTYVEELQSTEDRKYQVKVTDKNSGKTYVRLATREKISQLRLNPNISEVEIISIDPDVQTGYGSPYEGERKKGEQTAAVTSGKGLKDYDGDGKVESGAKEYRGVVHNDIQRKKGGTPDGKDTSSVKEDYLYEAGKKKVKKSEKFDVMPPGKKNKITIGAKEGGSPDGGIINAHTELQGTVIVETGYSKFLKIVSSGKGEKEKLNPAKVDMDGPQVGCDDPDPRSMKTASNLVKTKLRLMGLRPLMMSNEPDGEQIDEVLGGVPGDGYIGHPNLDIKNPFAKTQKKEKVLQKAAPGSGGLINRLAAQMGDRNPQLNSYEPEGDQLDEMGPLAGLAVKGALAAGTALAGKAVYDKAKGVAGKMQQRNQQTQQAIDSLKNSFEPEGEMVDEARAIGRTRSTDANPRGAAVRVSSGRGSTMTPARGLGASKPKGDDEERSNRQKEQAKKDRRAAARDRAEEGEDRLSRLVRSVQNSSYEPEGEMVDEARAEEKRGLGSTGAQRQRQKKGVVTSYGEIAYPATSYSGGQNPQLRGKEGKTKEQRRAASRRYVDQPGGVYAKPENKEGEGRYSAKQSKKRPDLGSRFD